MSMIKATEKEQQMKASKNFLTRIILKNKT